MDRSAKSGVAADRREEHYLRRMRHHSERYEEFHWQSVELLINLVYTCEVIESHMAGRLAARGLSLGSFNALMILSRFERAGCPMHELGELLLVSRANTTGLVDLLERRGLVERFASEADRRVRLVRLTRAGQALLESILPADEAAAQRPRCVERLGRRVARARGRGETSGRVRYGGRSRAFVAERAEGCL